MQSVQICRDHERVVETLISIYCDLVILAVQVYQGCFEQLHSCGQISSLNHLQEQRRIRYLQVFNKTVRITATIIVCFWSQVKQSPDLERNIFFLPASQSDWDTLLESALATNHHQPYDPKTTAEDTYCVSFVPHLLQSNLLFCMIIKSEEKSMLLLLRNRQVLIQGKSKSLLCMKE